MLKREVCAQKEPLIQMQYHRKNTVGIGQDSGFTVANGVIYYTVTKTIIAYSPSTLQNYVFANLNEKCTVLATAGGILVSGQSRHKGFKTDVKVWHLRTGGIISIMKQHIQTVKKLSISDGLKLVASSDSQNNVFIWNLHTGEIIAKKQQRSLSAFCFVGDDLALGLHSKLILIDTKTLSTKVIMEAMPRSKIERLFLCEGKIYSQMSSDITLILKQTSHSRQIELTKREEMNIELLVSNRQAIASTSNLKLIRMDLFSKKILQEIQLPDKVIALFPLNGSLIVFCASGILKASFNTKSTQTIVEGIGGIINQVVFPNKSYHVFACCSNQLSLLKFPSLEIVCKIKVKNAFAMCAAFFDKGSKIFSGWSDGDIRVYTPITGKLIGKIVKAHPSSISQIISNNDLLHIATSDDEGMIRIWKFNEIQHELQSSFNLHKSEIMEMAFTKDNHLISVSSEGLIIKLDWLKGQIMSRGKIKQGISSINLTVPSFPLIASTLSKILRVDVENVCQVKELGLLQFQIITFIHEQITEYGTSLIIGSDTLDFYDIDRFKNLVLSASLDGHASYPIMIMELDEYILTVARDQLLLWEKSLAHKGHNL